VTFIVYINTAGDENARERDLIEIDAAGFPINMGSVLVEQASDASSAAARPALQRAVRRLAFGDTLVVAHFSSLGNAIGDVIATLKTVSARGARVICLESGSVDLAAAGTGSPLNVLQLASDVERNAKRTRALDAAAAAKKDGVVQGRPASLSNVQREQALGALAAGNTVSAVARGLRTSRQTIIRLRDAKPRGATK
jgi:putative DNA-invertase from lambdoid prophage Rac